MEARVPPLSPPSRVVSSTLQRQVAQADPSTHEDGYKLVFDDEFNGPNGSRPDPSHWTFDKGGDGWGNDEQEYYTDRPQNAVVRDGKLVITARKEDYTGPDGVTRQYTSSRLHTFKSFSQTYGRFEARIKVPAGQGMWPAFWMLGHNIAATHWPDCGEIDVMENLGREPSTVHGTLHGPGYSGGDSIGGPYTLPNHEKFSDDFHTFAVEWKPDSVSYFVDGHKYQEFTPKNLPPGKTWVYDHPFSIIMNVAVGGGWPGNPDSTTPLPQEMQVDWVRVYAPDGKPSGPQAKVDTPAAHGQTRPKRHVRRGLHLGGGVR